MRRAALVGLLVALTVAAAAGAVGPHGDHAAVSLSVLVSGENGSVQFDRNTNDQAKLYDALTPLFDKVGEADVRRLFKPAGFGAASAKPTRAVPVPRAGTKIVRDRFGVAHVNGKTRGDVYWGAG